MTRYLFRHLLTVTVFIAFTLTAVIWLTQSLKLLELIANSDAPSGIFIQLVALSLPRFLEIIFPIALVAAIIFIYNKFIMDNEIIVLQACGFNHATLAKPAVILAVGLTILLLSFTTYVSPRSYTEMQSLRQDVKTQYSSFLLREGVFNTFGRSLTVYLGKRDHNGDLLGIMIHDAREKDKPPATVLAKRGRILLENDIPSILVFDGMRQQMDANTKTISTLHFSKYTIEVKGLEATASERIKDASERTFIELLNPNMTDRYDRNHLSEFKTEIHHRLLTPLNGLGFALCALAFMLLGTYNRRGQTKKILMASTTVIILQSLSLLLINASEKDPRFLIPLYLVTFLPIVLGGYALTPEGEAYLRHLLRLWRIHHPLYKEATP